MSVLVALISKERNRNNRMIIEYNNELNNLPKGSIKSKKINDKVYYYLSFRNGDKVISKYVGKNEDELSTLQEQLQRRKQIEEILKKLKEEQKQISKLEAIL